MKIFDPEYSPLEKTIFDDSNTITRLGASIQDGVTTIHRRLYFIADDVSEDATDIVNLKWFPQKGSAYHRDSSFTFTGNATIEPLSERSKYWMVDLEYSKNSTGGGGGGGDIEPWKLPPENLSFTYPELTMPFRRAYDSKGESTVPVLNSAGDVIIANHNIRNMQMSFTFNKKKVENDVFEDYCGTTNKSTITICGTKIPAERGVLLGLEYNLMNTYDDKGKLKWQYWRITCTILLDVAKAVIKREFLNTGNRAFFNGLNLSDCNLLSKAKAKNSNTPTSFAGTPSKPKKPDTVVSLRLPVVSSDNKNVFQTGKKIFCSYDQFIAMQQAFTQAAKDIGIQTPFYAQFEQESNVPLTKTGYVNEEAYENKKYVTIIYRQYPVKNWSGLDLPKDYK